MNETYQTQLTLFRQEPTDREMAATLFNIASLLRERRDNPYRVRAYERGARALLARRDPRVAARLRDSDALLAHGKGVLGARVQARLRELARTGRMETWDELCADLPPFMGALMTLPGVGPALARRLHDQLGVETAQALAEAARSGRARDVWGVGPKRAAAWADWREPEAREGEGR